MVAQGHRNPDAYRTEDASARSDSARRLPADDDGRGNAAARSVRPGRLTGTACSDRQGSDPSALNRVEAAFVDARKTSIDRSSSRYRSDLLICSGPSTWKEMFSVARKPSVASGTSILPVAQLLERIPAGEAAQRPFLGVQIGESPEPRW